MTAKVLDKEKADKICFITFIVPEFAKGYKMGMQEAYFYLKEFGGMDYLYKHWRGLHADNPYWAIRDMAKVCRNNGGWLKMIVY